MGALLRTEVLVEVLPGVAAELLTALGWQGTTVVVLTALAARGFTRGRGEAAPPPASVNVACVATVLLALILLTG